ncbi:hypothetical protein ACFOKF_13265 [Sphingobium rhizovicinum]|uniref:NAD(P)(+) transhydrogenase (Re/Si-specific) subunit beta n=1 Tax=Sphingobium rhizovicinum TaxID=432308 RepID=A0ABV7NFR0_9SPHN
MTAGFAALLGARIDGIAPSPFVAFLYLLAGLCLLLALRWGSGRRAGRVALLGVALASGGALYSHDVMNLPEMLGAIVVGGGLGLLLVRRAARRMLPILLRISQGLLGVAAVATAGAVWRNPGAFGLEGDGAAMTLLAAAALIGMLVCLGAIWPGRVGALILSGGAGWAGALLGLAIGNSAMVIGGALAGVAGLSFVLRGRKMARSASEGLPRAPGLP